MLSFNEAAGQDLTPAGCYLVNVVTVVRRSAVTRPFSFSFFPAESQRLNAGLAAAADYLTSFGAAAAAAAWC